MNYCTWNKDLSYLIRPFSKHCLLHAITKNVYLKLGYNCVSDTWRNEIDWDNTVALLVFGIPNNYKPKKYMKQCTTWKLLGTGFGPSANKRVKYKLTNTVPNKNYVPSLIQASLHSYYLFQTMVGHIKQNCYKWHTKGLGRIQWWAIYNHF